MNIRPIHTDADYRAVLREVSAYFENEPEPDSPEGDRFEVLRTLLEAYEAKHFPIDLPNPVEAIKFRMEQAGLRLTPDWRQCGVKLTPALRAVDRWRQCDANLAPIWRHVLSSRMLTPDWCHIGANLASPPPRTVGTSEASSRRIKSKSVGR